MSDTPRKRIFTLGGALALAIAVAILLSLAGPTFAQFFDFGGFQQRPQKQQRGGGWFGGSWFGNDTFDPFQQRPAQPRLDRRQARPMVREDFSKAPAPEKRDTIPERNVLVMGDGMADWLAYGLEDAYAERPDMGVIRKAKNTSGLLKYQPKGEPADWAEAARGILATEKADVVVIMLGLNDRVAMREPTSEDSDKPSEKKIDKKDAHAKDDRDKKGDAKPDNKPADTKPDAAAKPKDGNTELQDEAGNPDAPPVAITRERTARSPKGLVEFRDERWIELYSKKIEDMIAAAKSKGVPVIWVGLPAVGGAKGISDMLFLDSLYRGVAAKAGITYVDVWDGFVDERGLFLQKGPDFEGQIRQLRSYDGVYFTKPGARKLAHYVDREITRLLASRSAPVALPTEPATPDANAIPGQLAPRPIAGPIVPLVASSLGGDQLLGGPGSRPAAVDALAARTLVKGEPLSPPPGRADDYAWPHREVGREPAKEPSKSDVPVAVTTPGAETGNGTPQNSGTAGLPRHKPSPRLQRPQNKPVQTSPFGNFFGFGTPPPLWQAPPPAQRGPIAPGVPRPSAPLGRAASVDDTTR